MKWLGMSCLTFVSKDQTTRLLKFLHSFRSEKLQNESFPNFSNFPPEFCPEFCSEFSWNFSRTFRASFRGRRRPEKIHQKSPPFFNAKFPGKHEKNIHKILLESRQSNILHMFPKQKGNQGYSSRTRLLQESHPMGIQAEHSTVQPFSASLTLGKLSEYSAVFSFSTRVYFGQTFPEVTLLILAERMATSEAPNDIPS